MSMTIVVTRNASSRLRGFLASTMLEVSPGVYCGPRISPSVRETIWAVMEEWFPSASDASIVMIWNENAVPGGHAVKMLGSPPMAMVELDGLVVARRASGDLSIPAPPSE